ncbi:MAG TPA: hypothetical protein VLU24_10180, partial [Mycobacterium sp.]|nr:hypothetical protein [Mycobacterium sp.]
MKRLLRPVGTNRRVFALLATLLLLATAVFALCGASEAQAAIAQRSVATSATGSTGTTLTINKPAGVVAGDVMLVAIAKQGNTTAMTAPTGWTLIDGRSLAGSTSRFAAVMYRVADGTEGSSFAFALGGTGISSSSGAIVAFSGVNSVSPFDVAPGTISVQASQVGVSATTITTVSDGAAVLMFGMAAGSNPTYSGWSTTSPGSLTELFDVGQAAGSSVGGAWAIKPTAGATGAGSATLSGAERNGGILIALAPPDALAPTTATVTNPSGGAFFRATAVPSAFSGSAADNSGGIGLNANSTTFTLQRVADGWYWDGVSSWQATSTPISLATTHAATTGGASVTWSSNVPLPAAGQWNEGDYLVQATAVDKLGHSFTGTAISFTVNNESVAPALASVSFPVDGSIYRTATMPSPFSGSAADDANGVGLAANSVTFLLQRSDGAYWNGSAWQAGAFPLAATNGATTTGTAVPWNSVALPTWSAQVNAGYSVTARVVDRVGNVTTGTPATFTFDRVAPTSATVASPTAGNYRSSDLPLTFSGVVSDDTSGSGLASNSTTLTIQNPSGQYWNGGSWQSSAYSLTTTHGSTSGGSATTWVSSVAMPDWTSQTQGTYTVRATAFDRAGNALSGSSVAFVLDDTAPITASVTTPINGSTFAAIQVPTTFAGSAADNAGGAGLNANSTSFTLQRPGDAWYWNGLGWQQTVFPLSTTHGATTGNTAASWSGSALM